jgi:hypothetical protein
MRRRRERRAVATAERACPDREVSRLHIQEDRRQDVLGVCFDRRIVQDSEMMRLQLLGDPALMDQIQRVRLLYSLAPC